MPAGGLFRRSVVEQFGFLDERLRYCMDYEYWLRIGKEKAILLSQAKNSRVPIL